MTKPDKPALRVIDDADEREAEHERAAARRRGGEGSAGEDVAGLLARALAGAPPLDDAAAWAERDAKIQAERDRAAAAEERTRLEKRAALFVADLDFPERAVACAVAPDKTVPIDAALAWAPTTRKNILVLCGDQGIGKTVAACAIALRSSYQTWRYVRAHTFQATSKFDRARREDFTAGALILDDLGSEYADAKGSFLSDMDELVDFYYSRPSRPLIITTNVAAKHFPTRYRSERMMGRIRESAVWREFADAPCLRPAAKGAPAAPGGQR